MPILAISVLSGPLQRASKGPGPDLANFGYFRIKRSFTKSLSGPYLANFGYFCIKRPFTKSLEGPGPKLCQFWLFLY